jgi:hypothetical protein
LGRTVTIRLPTRNYRISPLDFSKCDVTLPIEIRPWHPTDAPLDAQYFGLIGQVFTFCKKLRSVLLDKAAAAKPLKGST